MTSGYQIFGHGKPLVCLHSSMSTSKQFMPLVGAMSNKRQCILIDLYGYGDAPQVESTQSDEFSLDTEVQRIERILNELGVEQFDVVGHSYGAATALELAYQHQSKVSKLALFEPVAFHLLAPQHPVRLGVVNMAKKLRELAPMDAAALFLEYWNGEGWFASLPAKVQQQFMPQVEKVILDFQGLINNAHGIEHYASMEISVLLTTGQYSKPSAYAVADVIAAGLKNVSVNQVAAGHMAPLSHPHLVVPVWQQFFSVE